MAALALASAIAPACTEGMIEEGPAIGVRADLVLAGTATASSIQATGYEAAKAVDNNTSTRWSSQFSDPQWITVDLGAIKSINEVKLSWEAAYGKAYQLRASTDNATWTTIESVTAGDGGVDDFTGLSVSARYVQMYGTARATQYGYSLWEMTVIAPDATTGAAGAGGAGG
ncbi:MAG TPA: discoidin domain-containing protein, partial [Polyangia bacterium]|nr:discoidin domain-containing protein [Polyangia bacterium]